MYLEIQPPKNPINITRNPINITREIKSENELIHSRYTGISALLDSKKGRER